MVPALAALVMTVENASFAVTCPNLVDLDGRKSAVKGENVSLRTENLMRLNENTVIR